MLLLAEPSAIAAARRALEDAAPRLSTSTTSPTFVLVPCASTRVAVAGSRPASRQARSHASLCPTGFGRRDALALAVARPADAPDDGVDAIAVTLGIGKALEQERGGALAHHEAVGAIAEGPRARWR